MSWLITYTYRRLIRLADHGIHVGDDATVVELIQEHPAVFFARSCADCFELEDAEPPEAGKQYSAIEVSAILSAIEVPPGTLPDDLALYLKDVHLDLSDGQP